MSRRMQAAARQAVCCRGLLHRIQPAAGYWQLPTQGKRRAVLAGTHESIPAGISSSRILGHSWKISLDSYPIPTTKAHFFFSKDMESNTAGKHLGKLDADTSGLADTVESLLNLRFTQDQVKQLLNLNPRIAAQVPMKDLPVLYILENLGLNPRSTFRVLERCPELFGAKEHQLQSRIDNLRKHGLGEGRLQRVVVYCPQILNLPAKQVNNTVRFFKDKCIFTGQQVTEILQTSPNVLFEKCEELEYKFQFVYFQMGIKQAEIVKSGIFRVSMEELRQRHIFLERLGRYQTPDKKGQTQIINPKPKSIFTTTENYFLAKVAMSSWEEFDTFKKLLRREEMEKELGNQEDRGTSASQSDSEEDEELSDTEDEELFPVK
ncbi:transcription termination factor 4, mitochondrial [Rhinoraja longicauda]